MSLLLLFADQSAEPGGPALLWELPRPVFAYLGRARVNVAAAGRSSFVTGTRPAASAEAPVAAAPTPVMAPAAYRFTGRAHLHISEKGMAILHDPWAEARRDDEELLLLE